MSTLNEIAKTFDYIPLEVNSIIDALNERGNIRSELLNKINSERGNAELNQDEQDLVENELEELIVNNQPCGDCGHVFTPYEDMYLAEFDNSTGVLCSECFEKRYPTEESWSKAIIKYNENLSDEEIDALSPEELEEKSAEDCDDSDSYYYTQAG